MQPRPTAARGLTRAARALRAAPLLALAACARPAAAPPTTEVVIAPPPRASASSLAPLARPLRDARIRQVSVGVYEVEAGLFDDLVARPASSLPFVRAEPVSEEGQFVGHRLLGVAPGSLLERLGLLDDDVIELVNGESGRTPRSIEAARSAAQRTAQVTVVLRRNGFQKLMVYRLVYY